MQQQSHLALWIRAPIILATTPFLAELFAAHRRDVTRGLPESSDRLLDSPLLCDILQEHEVLRVGDTRRRKNAEQ